MSVAENAARSLHKTLKNEYDKLFKLKEDDNGFEIWPIFNVLPPKKDYPDYYNIIKNPVSFNTLKKRVPHYTNPQDFMNDLAQIPWNAKTYNAKGSSIYKYGDILENFIKKDILVTLQRSYPQLKYPYLGPLPDEIQNQQLTAMQIAQFNDNDENRKSRPTIKLTFKGQYENGNNSNSSGKNDLPGNLQTSQAQSPATSHSSTPQPRYQRPPQRTHIRRGRPPVIDLPYILRMKNVFKMLRKEVDHAGEPLTATFERLPDKEENPEYYAIITNPIAMDEIRKKVKARRYKDFPSFQDDIHRMLDNYKIYHKSNPQNIKRALQLEQEIKKLIQIELARPDEEFMPEGDLRRPLDDLVINDETYTVGDWVLLDNINDRSKPTVGQIFRMWSTPDGKRWFNACWYLRPEQTVHRVDRLFYKNEVFKTGQYRDHLAEDIRGKCYVVHFTRYQRGNPDIDINGPLFICEFRYNESDKNFNKIRTWKACLPEEIRDQEEVTVPVNGRKFFKYPSPIKHLLPPNATYDDPIPQPTLGSPSAPPLVGAVYLRPKLERDDLGEYSTSDDCPRYIIRPGDPTEDGVIDYENGTIVTTIQTMSNIPKAAHSGTRPPMMKVNKSMSSTDLLQNVPLHRGSTPQNMGTPLSRYGTPGIGNNQIPISIKSAQLLKHKQQFQHKKLEAHDELPNIVLHLTQKSSKGALGQISLDTPGSYVLPVAFSEKIQGLQYTDYDNMLRRLGKSEVPAAKSKHVGELLWFKGPSVTVQEKMINSGDSHVEIPLNRWFPTKKKRKLEYEEIEEPITDETTGVSSKPTSNSTTTSTSLISNEDDEDNVVQSLPGSFACGLRPSTRFLAFKVLSNNSS